MYNNTREVTMTILTTRAIYTGGVLKPATKLDLPDGAAVEVRISPLAEVPVTDPKDALMDDGVALQIMYAEFAQEERQLAETGMAYYAETLRQEEKQP